jgi:flagellar basal body-associated protein FliL
MTIVKIVSIGLLFIIAASVFAAACNWFGDGVQTLQKEYAPSALLKKYEDFKRISAAIDKKRADINLYREELSTYYDVDGKLLQNDKETRQYLEQRKSELIGIISIHNQLVADYNTRTT